MKFRSLIWVPIAIVLLFGCLVMGAVPPPVVVIARLLVGWAFYLNHVTPQVTINWSGVFSGAICLIAILLLGHWIASWLWRETHPSNSANPRWKPTWTAALTTIVVLLFLSGMAAVGIAHQSAWLATSDKPMFHDAASRIWCASHMKQIGLAIQLYSNENSGKFPDTLEQVLLTQDISPEVMICPASKLEKSPGNTPEEQAKHLHEGHVSYIYVGKGLRSASATQPILFEFPENHEFKGANILFSDSHVEWFTLEQARRILKDFVE
jgi:prepilin-type processing-associated H-X9-DG protein